MPRDSRSKMPRGSTVYSRTTYSSPDRSTIITSSTSSKSSTSSSSGSSNTASIVHTHTTQTVNVEKSLWQSIKEGFGWRIGSNLAHGWFEPTPKPQKVEHTHTHVAPQNPDYEQCMKESANNAEACKHYLTNFTQQTVPTPEKSQHME